MPPIVVLNVAEKPSVARSLAEVFSSMPGSQDRPMQRGAAQIFVSENVRFPSVFRQGNGQHINGPDVPHTMITTSVRGHLSSQDFPPTHGWSAVPPVALFTAPIETSYRNDMEPLERMLSDQSRNCAALVLWLDCDREGEAISDEVREVCLRGNPRLNGKVYRAKFSTVLPNEIQRALRSLGRVNENFVAAVHARSEHDLRVGAAFTRFQTLRLQKKFDGFADAGVVSYGPCQFPTLGFVVERWARIETFIPEDFWFLEMTVRLNEDGTVVDGTLNTGNNNGNGPQQEQQRRGGAGRPITLKWSRDRLYDRLVTLALYESCLDAQTAVVTSLTGRPKNKWRPIPLATVELQKRASRYLRIGSETLMTAAEALYNDGYISYPRTETERFRPEFDHAALIGSFRGVGGEFGEYSNKLLSNNNFQNPRLGQHDDNAHPPITPAKAVDPSTIPDQTQRNIYVLVVKHYLACCSRDAIGKETQLTIKMASEEFSAKGLMILERNWLEIYSPWERWSTGQGILPRVRVGSRLVPTSLVMKEGRTTAPSPISEVELISLMDRNGIGTDATIAQHITTIQDRSYATKDPQQKFHPTKLGIALVEGYNSMGYQLNKPDLRREMESQCNQIATGQKTKEQVLGPTLTKMLECFNRATAEAHKLDEAVSRHYQRLGANNANAVVLNGNFSECGLCHRRMTLKALGGGRNGRDGANRGGAGVGTNVQRKILYCNTCSLGLPLPRGELRPMCDPQNQDTPFKCPICHYQVISISRGEGYNGNGYHVCPKCYTDSPVEHGGNSSGDMRCFSCTHPTCRLATGTRGGDIEVFPCPFCQSAAIANGKIHLKKTSRGYILSCSNGGQGRDRCQYTIWLPKAAGTVSIPDYTDEGTGGGIETATTSCNQCTMPDRTVRKIKFVWKAGSVPPHFEREYTGCVLCDDFLRRDMEIKLPQMNVVRNRRGGRGGRGNNRSGRGQSRSTERQRAGRGTAVSQQSSNNVTGSYNSVSGGTHCFRCGQSGHYAPNCQNNNR